jgi:hypothetical protein
MYSFKGGHGVVTVVTETLKAFLNMASKVVTEPESRGKNNVKTPKIILSTKKR